MVLLVSSVYTTTVFSRSGLTHLSDILGSAAFSVVQNDLKGNITVRSSANAFASKQALIN